MDDDYYDSSCPACGEYIDYCQGHGELGDPDGHKILSAHDKGDHSNCDIHSSCRQLRETKVDRTLDAAIKVEGKMINILDSSDASDSERKGWLK